MKTTEVRGIFENLLENETTNQYKGSLRKQNAGYFHYNVFIKL